MDERLFGHMAMFTELQEYRKIGTVDECRKAMEREMPKKVKYNRQSLPFCMNCGITLSNYSGEENYCENCGQAIKWED